MKKNSQKKTPEQMIQAALALDLESIKSKLMDPDEGQGWTQAQADLCEVEYKRFLVLAGKYPDAGIVPSANVDKFWHTHILNTRSYAQDCEKVFGYFLHHAPHYGERTGDAATELAAAFTHTLRLYAQEFGSRATVDAGSAASGKDPAVQNGAWCSVTNEKFGTRAAWSSVANEETGMQAAWSSVTSGKAGKKAGSKTKPSVTAATV